MIEITEVASADDLADLRRAYLASLTAPQDGMWESFATMGRHLALRSDGQLAGYACLNEQGQMLQFHVAAPFERDADALFSKMLARDDVKGAMVSTADPLFVGLCLDAHKTLRVHTFLYQAHGSTQATDETSLAGGAEASLDVVEDRELDAIVALQRDSLDPDPGEWLIGYLTRLIERRELYALRVDGEILGTGEARVSDSQPPFVDLGVITARSHRRRGVAAHILARLKQHCHERELTPICSTTAENIGARRAIAKAGFVSRHRLLEIEL